MASSASAFSKFSEEKFDPKEWINAALRNKDPQQGLDAHASTLVMKLQLIIQEVNNALEETSLQAVQSLPRVLHDVEAVRQEAQLLREQMQIVKDDIRKVEEETHQSMKHLLQVDRIKSRMQDAKGALEQAGKWASHVSDMDSVFSTQPPHVIATKLSAMRQSLDVLHDVNDYEERVSLLESYCNRLEAQLSTPLLEAFNMHSLDLARDYADMFSKIGRSAQLQSYYIRCHKASLLQCWSSIHKRLDEEADEDKKIVSHWLAEFYDELLSVWHAEVVWCHQVLPTPSSVLCSLFSQTLTGLQPSLESCVKRSVQGVTETEALPHLIAIRDVTLRFAKQLEKSLTSLFDGEDGTCVRQLADAVHSPYQQYLLEYENMEKGFLLALLANIRLDVVGLMDTVRWIADSVPKVFDTSEMALQHCLSFTAGFGAQCLLNALEHFLSEYCSRVSTIVNTVRTNAGLESPHSAAPDAVARIESDRAVSSMYGEGSATDEDWTQLHNGVKLIEACGDMLVHADAFEERLRVVLTGRCTAALAESSTSTSHASTPTSGTVPSYSGMDGSDVSRSHSQAVAPSCLSVYNYFTNAQASKETAFRRLTSRLSSSTSAASPGTLLPAARRQLLELNDKAHLYSFDAIMAQLRWRLVDMAQLPVWSSSGDSDEDSQASVPMFSLAPLDYIQQVTECLLSLPQELEHLSSSDMSPALLAALRAGNLPHMVIEEESSAADSGHDFADQWLGCFARGLLDLFVQSVLSIPRLSVHGCRQLVADIAYLCKVIDAFGVSPCEDLEHLQTLLSSSHDSYATLATTTSPLLYSKVAKMRGVSS